MTSGPAAPGSWVSTEFGITLSGGESPVGLTMTQLIRVALRRNPRRAQLLVSTVLGKHLPADPRIVAGTGRLLGALVGRALDDAAGPVPPEWALAAEATVSGAEPGALLAQFDAGVAADRPTGAAPLTLGFAETATSLGHLVADQLGSAYLHSTRRTDGDVPVAAEFSEPHSHATGHLLRPDPPTLLTGAGPVVLVDDELSTGRTALNVIEALHAVAPRKLYVLAGLVDLRSAADDLVRAEVARRLGCRIEVVSLVRGSIAVPPDARERVWAAVGTDSATDDAGSADRGGSWTRLDLPWPAGVPMGGRYGFTPVDRPAFDRAVNAVAAAIAAGSGDAARILVVGTEELMYLPLQIALQLSRNPALCTAFQSTTRSPVHAADRVGYPIRRRVDFTGTDRQHGDEVPVVRHLYNADWPTTGGRPTAVGDDGAREADLIVVVDDGHAVDGPDGVAARIAALTGRPVVLAVLPAADSAASLAVPGAAAAADLVAP